jgi:protoporphyrinogen oxidase
MLVAGSGSNSQESERGIVKVAVIGAGITGLLSAYRLSARCAVSVYEQHGSLGGLGAAEKSESGAIEKYNHCISRSDREIIRVAAELGLARTLAWRRARQCFIIDGRCIPASAPLDLFSFPMLSIAQKIALAAFLLRMRIIPLRHRHSRENARELVVKYCGEAVFRQFFQPLLGFKYSRWDDISAAYLRARICEDKHTMLGTFSGGMDTLFQGLAGAVKKNAGIISLSDEVQTIKRGKNSSWEILSARGEASYDKVISTLPFSRTMALFEKKEVPTPGIPVEYLGVVSAVLRLERPLKPGYWLFMSGSSSRELQVVIDTSAVNNRSLVYFPRYCRGDSGKPAQAEFFAECAQLCERINPLFNRSWILEQRCFMDSMAEPVFTNDFINALRDDSEYLPGVYIPELLYEPHLLKTFNTAAIKSRITAAKVMEKAC